MNNLYERATPELKKALAVYAIDYPSTAEVIIEDMKANTIVSWLRFNTVMSLKSIAERSKVEFNLTDPWKYFAPPVL